MIVGRGQVLICNAKIAYPDKITALIAAGQANAQETNHEVRKVHSTGRKRIVRRRRIPSDLRKGALKGRMDVYECPVCKEWHLTHSPQTEKLTVDDYRDED